MIGQLERRLVCARLSPPPALACNIDDAPVASHTPFHSQTSLLRLIHFPLVRYPIPPLHLVCARLSPPPALALRLSLHWSPYLHIPLSSGFIGDCTPIVQIPYYHEMTFIYPLAHTPQTTRNVIGVYSYHVCAFVESGVSCLFTIWLQI